MTDVIDHVVDVDITKLVINADTTVIVGGMFSNADITQEFFYRELALFAHGDDNTEVMYCYANAGEFAERITPMGGASVIEKAIDINRDGAKRDRNHHTHNHGGRNIIPRHVEPTWGR
jgi:hypothetical protein